MAYVLILMYTGLCVLVCVCVCVHMYTGACVGKREIVLMEFVCECVCARERDRGRERKGLLECLRERKDCVSSV